jgi:hypothetical protein
MNQLIEGIILRVWRSSFIVWDGRTPWFIDLAPEDRWPCLERAVRPGRSVRLRSHLNGTWTLRVRLGASELVYPELVALVSTSSREQNLPVGRTG